MDEILFLEPHFTHNVWGGNKLSTQFHYDVEGDDIGECWGISAHENGSSVVKNGTYKGKSLKELVEEKPELFGLSEPRFPLLIKIIDAQDDLSIQVHPDDEYARENENGSLGKSECWYILDAEEGASIVLGHNAKTREELKERVEAGDFSTLFETVPVKAGDLVQILPGTIHAIKGGLLLLETQENSDITYRVYDYDRLWHGKKRELKLKESLDVITVPGGDPESMVFRKEEIEAKGKVNVPELILEDPHFILSKLTLSGSAAIENEGFTALSVVRGEGKINGLPFKKGDHMILTSNCREAALEGDAELVFSSVSGCR